MMIRARRREHMEKLLERFGTLIPPGTSIVENAGTDYRYRVFMPKAAWTAVLAALAEDVDYDNFKNAAHTELDGTSGGRVYTRSLTDVWDTMYEIQP
jgi:hypothetical protein